MASRLTINTNSLNVPWQLGTQYRIALDADIVKEVGNNRSGNPAVNNLSTFTTNATVPTLSSSSPADSAFDVENNTSILMTFSRNVEAGVGNIRLYQVEVGGADTLLYTYNMGDPAYVTFSTNTVTLKTTGLLEADSAYYLVFDNNAIRDIDNFNYVGSRTAKTITANGNAVLNNTVTKWPGVDSIQFDGVGDYLSVPSSADFGYGTGANGAFEISAWIRPTTASQTSVIVDHRPTATEGLYPTLRLQSGVLQYYTNSAVRITGTTITPNTWTFVQVARFAGTTRLYVNGGQVGSDYTDSNTYPTAAVKIGVNGVDLSAGFTGYMSDILIKKSPIGLGGFRTRSSVNDDYTVLAIVGSFNDLISTIFFDTQEEALGFPSLSASITGAFAPTMTVKRTAAGQIVMANNFVWNIQAGKRLLLNANLSATITMVTNTERYETPGELLFNVPITMQIIANQTARPNINITAVSSLTVPYFNTDNWSTSSLFVNDYDNYPAAGRVIYADYSAGTISNIYYNSSASYSIKGNPNSGTSYNRTNSYGVPGVANVYKKNASNVFIEQAQLDSQLKFNDFGPYFNSSYESLPLPLAPLDFGFSVAVDDTGQTVVVYARQSYTTAIDKGSFMIVYDRYQSFGTTPIQLQATWAEYLANAPSQSTPGQFADIQRYYRAGQNNVGSNNFPQQVLYGQVAISGDGLIILAAYRDGNVYKLQQWDKSVDASHPTGKSWNFPTIANNANRNITALNINSNDVSQLPVQMNLATSTDGAKWVVGVDKQLVSFFSGYNQKFVLDYPIYRQTVIMNPAGNCVACVTVNPNDGYTTLFTLHIFRITGVLGVDANFLEETARYNISEPKNIGFINDGGNDKILVEPWTTTVNGQGTYTLYTRS